jgi:hypothetical protein
VAYATTDELAAALRIALTPANQAGLQACLDAAAVEIDDAIGAIVNPPDPAYAGALLNRVNLLRGVEWWKANDAAFGSPAGQPGALALPPSSFAAHSATLTPLKSVFGVA